MTIYGFNKLLAEHLKLPMKFIESVCHWEHGIIYRDKPLLISDLQAMEHQKIMLVFASNNFKQWKEVTRKQVFLLLEPFIYYRKKYNITKNKNANGTLFFLPHRTELIDTKYNKLNLVKKLKNLPSYLQPVDICVHHEDIKRNNHLYFEEYGFKVHTAGDMESSEFSHKFYKIIKNFAYTSSLRL